MRAYDVIAADPRRETVKYREIYLVVISLISIVWTRFKGLNETDVHLYVKVVL